MQHIREVWASGLKGKLSIVASGLIALILAARILSYVGMPLALILALAFYKSSTFRNGAYSRLPWLRRMPGFGAGNPKRMALATLVYLMPISLFLYSAMVGGQQKPSSPAAIPAPTQTVFISPTSAPTIIRAVVIATPEPTEVPAATSTPKPTDIPKPTDTPKPTATSNRSATETAVAAQVFAQPTKSTPTRTPRFSLIMYVSAGGDGVYIRSAPDREARVKVWPDGTEMMVSDQEGDWYKVQAPDGYIGYIPAEYLAVSRPPTPTPVVVPTSTSTPAPVTTGVTFISVSGGPPGGYASVTVQTNPGASCSIVYVTPAGTVSEAQGLENKTAGENGRASWLWKIGSNTRRGTGRVTVTCNRISATAPIQIQ